MLTPDTRHLQQPPRFCCCPLLLEEAHSISRHVQVHDDMKMSLGRPYTAFGRDLDNPIFTMHRHLVHPDNAAVGWIAD